MSNRMKESTAELRRPNCRTCDSFETARHAVLAAEMDIQGRVTGGVAAATDAVHGAAAGVQRAMVRQLMVRTPSRPS